MLELKLPVVDNYGRFMCMGLLCVCVNIPCIILHVHVHVHCMYRVYTHMYMYVLMTGILYNAYA